MSGNSYRMPDTMLAVVLLCDRKQDVNSCMQVCSVISERIWYRLRVFVICEDICQVKKGKLVARCRPRGGHLLGTSSRQDSNLQPADYKTAALPTELQKHVQEKRFS